MIEFIAKLALFEFGFICGASAVIFLKKKSNQIIIEHKEDE